MMTVVNLIMAAVWAVTMVIIGDPWFMLAIVISLFGAFFCALIEW